MKKIRILFLSMAVAVLGFINSGCQKAEYGVIENIAYLADAANSPMAVKSVKMEAVGATTVDVVVRLAKPAPYDIQVGVSIDNTILDAYNEKYGEEYMPIPEEYLHLPEEGTVTIKANELSTVFSVTVDKFEMFDEDEYCIPVMLTDISGGDIALSTKLSTLIYSLEQRKTLITSAPRIRNTHSIAMEGTWNFSPDAWTIEFLGLRTGNRANNAQQPLLEFYDGVAINRNYVYLTWAESSSTVNQFACKIQTYVIHSKALTSGQWYHYAVVNDGKHAYIYIDGELHTTGLFFGGPQLWGKPSGCWGNVQDLYFCQFRIWNVGRTQEEIQKNMYSDVKANDPRLIMYCKANEGSGHMLYDATGNGRNIKVTMNSGGADAKGLEWGQNFRFGE